MSNPRGNPEFGKSIKFTTDRPEPLNIKIGLRISRSMSDSLNALDDKNEFMRNAIATALSALDNPPEAAPAPPHVEPESNGSVERSPKKKIASRRNGPPCPSCGQVGVNPSKYSKGGFGSGDMPIVDRRRCDNDRCQLKTYLSVRGEDVGYATTQELRAAKGL